MEITIVCVPFYVDIPLKSYAFGPRAFLDQRLIQRIQARGHRVLDLIWIELPEAERTSDTATNLGRIAKQTSTAISRALQRKNSFVVVLEGDCTHALGAIGGLAQAIGEAPGIVWFDAHGDLNTRTTTTTGRWGGMPYAVALGWDFDTWRLAAGLQHPVKPEAAALIGTSDLDPAEIEALQYHPIAHMDASAITQPEVTERVRGVLGSRVDEAVAWYIHIDVDVAGPEEVPGGMTPAPHWPPRQHLIEAAKAAAQSLPVKVASLAAYNPCGDVYRRGAKFGLDMIIAVIDGVTS